MSFYENLAEFKGRPVEDWPGTAPASASFTQVVYRLRTDYDDEEPIIEKLAAMREAPGSEQIESLVIGAWQGEESDRDPADLVEALVGASRHFTRLKNIFLGDIISEENECSWIRQSDLSPLFGAYPKLEHLTVRGGMDLSFGSSLSHKTLRELIVQSGGLAVSAVHEIATAKLPALEHLELWLGEPRYGGEATVEDLSPFLSGALFPKLKYLGLKNSVVQDEIAGVIAAAPVLGKLETLDLSNGSLGDDGARAMLGSAGVGKLKKLDLSHHFISEPVQRQLKALGIEVDLSDAQEPHEWGGQSHRFISVSE